MSDFIIKLNAELDLSKIKKQIDNFDNTSLKLTNISIDTAKIQKSLNSAFDKTYKVKIDTGSITKQIEKAVKAGLGTTGGSSSGGAAKPSGTPAGTDKATARISASGTSRPRP